MAYYTRVFCSTQNKPTINGILERLRSFGFNVNVNLQEKELNTEKWTDFELIYDSDRLPLLVELNQIGKSDGFVEEEIDEFKEFVGKPRFYENKKKRIIRYLNRTEYIICIQLPTSDIVDKGYDVNGELMNFVESNYSGLTQIDAEGFYLNSKLLMSLK